VALYEALYGKRPFRGETLARLSESVLRGHVTEAPDGCDVPAGIREILLRGLRVDPKERWPTLKALLAELENDRLVAGRDRFVAGAASKLAAIWEAPVLGQPTGSPDKTEMRQSFVATGKAYARAAFETVSRLLDDYTKSWSDMYIDACAATHLRGEQSAEVLDLRMAFLHERLDELRALCQVFRHADADVVENAVAAAGALRSLERGANIKLLRALVAPPEDPAAQATVDELRARLAEARVLGQVGRLVDGLRIMEPLERTARDLRYGPLTAEILLEKGKLHADRLEADDADRALEEALWTAEINRHDEIAAEAATCLVYIAGDTQLRFDAGEIWARHAEAILRRMGGHERLWGWLFNNRGAMRERQGRLGDALGDARQAVAAKEKADGPDSADVARSLANMALYFEQLDQLDEAEQHGKRALEITQAGLGPEHPRTAILLSNYAEILNRLGRFAAAREMSRRSLAILEGEVDTDGLILTYPLTALGLAFLDDGMAGDALPILERAVKIRETKESEPSRRGEARFALARALTAAGGELPRARELATRARAE
jgi:tetratricopeptide (TPR) repeat protein